MSWIAGIFELLGTWIVGNKNKWGFIFNIVGNVFWIYIGIKFFKNSGGLLIVSPVALFINIRNFRKWKKEEITEP